MFFWGDARTRVSIRKTLEVRFEAVSSTTSNVKVLPTVSYRGKNIDRLHPAQGNPCNSWV